MSACNLDFLMQLWHASLVQHGDSAPFRDHRDLYSTIDATPIGGVLWESFNITYNGLVPESNVPAWMNQSFEVYFRDPRLLFVEMLGNPSFANDFDYTPYREFEANGTWRYQHFMSGNCSTLQSPTLSGGLRRSPVSLVKVRWSPVESGGSPVEVRWKSGGSPMKAEK